MVRSNFSAPSRDYGRGDCKRLQDRAINLLLQERDAVVAVAETLIAKRHLTGTEVTDIVAGAMAIAA